MDGIPLSYGALAEFVPAAAAWLRGASLGAGDVAALVLPNGPVAATTFLATASAGICAPLNPAYRAEEFAFYLEDLKARLLLVAEELDSPARAEARKRGIRIVEVGIPPAAEAGIFTLDGRRPEAGAAIEPAPDATALILHTSGTTARPKMVPLSQANLSASAAHIAATLGLGPPDRCLNVMPLFHIHGLVAGVLASLHAGGSVVCAPGFLGPSFMEWLAVTYPTWYTAVPTMHQAILARAAEPAHQGIVRGHRLRFVRSSSAALPKRILEELEKVLGVPVVEAYGMTEAAHQMASNPLPPGVRKPGSVGPAAGPEIAILDASGRPLPRGETGEVCIRGPNVTAGYRNNPEATARAFSGGWLRTGDEGALDRDGYLTLTGRLKEQINRAGEKISPLEVDGVLMDHPAVATALSFSVPHPVLGEDISAAVVLRPGARISERELRDYVAGRLAFFKTPRRILFVDAIPTGSTGKLQRLGLAERLGVTADVPVDDLDTTPPRTPVEEIVAAAWADVMGSPAPGVRRNFFALGGDSILATRLVARLRGLLAIELPLLALFDAPSVEGIARATEQLLELPALPAEPASPSAAMDGKGPALEYWRRVLDGADLSVDLPTDRARPSQPTAAWHTESLTLPPDLVIRLEDLARSRGTTPNAVLLATFRMLLYRVGGQEDLTLGYSQIAALVRTRVTETTLVDELIEEAGTGIAGALDHLLTPEDLRGVIRMPPEWPFRLLFSCPDGPGAPQLPGEDLDLSLAIRRSDAGTEAVMHTRADLYAPDTGRRLLRLFLTLLNGTAEGMVRQVSRLPLFEGDERERVLGLAAGYELPTRITRTVGELFLEQAGRNPGKTALIAENGTWTFATLAERAQALADELSRRGIGCGDVVAVVADRTLESVMAMVAVTLSGAAYLPADFDQPAERMQVMLADSGARLVLTDAAGETRLATSVPVQRFDRPGPVVTGAPSSRRAGPDDPVYVLFTSGSTGRPKGVMIPHRALINHMDWALDAFPIGPSDVILHRTPIGFDASVWEIWGPLFAGCPMVLARRSSDADPAYLREAIRTHGVTELQVVPSMLSLMVELNGFDGCDTLKRVFCGGEALPAELVRRFQAAHPAELNNLYGPTEVTIDAIWWRIPPGFSETSVPIGRPIPNVRAYVLDRQGEPTPIGVPGELYLGGVGVGLGYLNRPDLTEQRFRPDPFAGHGGRMYRTGDRARFQADGNLEFLGRLDDQLKLHGMRIEPGEIEAVMNARPDVLESAVGIVDSEWTGSRLVAWVVLHPGNTASADAFRADLASSLPRSLVPSGVLFLEKLPKLPSGKIDRRSLPAPIADMAEAASFQAPDTPTEQFVARVWAEILGRERVGRHDDLFLLGGHSLLAIRIANRLRGPVGVEITLETILEHPTVFSLAAELDRRATTAPHEVEASLPRIPRAARVQRHSAPRPPSVP